MMNAMRSLIGAGILVNAALYLGGLLAAALVDGNHLVVVAVIVSAGFAYLSYGAQYAEHWFLAGACHAISLIAAIAAPVLLLIGYLFR